MTKTVAIDVEQLIDSRPMGAFQAFWVVLCGSVALLDGFDTQAIGIAAPAIVKSFSLTLAQFAPVLSVGLLGAMVGAMAFGAAADRFGRKSVLVLTTLMFAAFSWATAESHDLGQLTAFRFLAGLGLGGATPCFIALTAEYVPMRLRGRLVAVMWAGFPLGGVLGAFVNPPLIARFGWHAVFYVGGALPLLLAILLALALPESLRYLVARKPTDGRILRILHKIAPGLPITGPLVVPPAEARPRLAGNPFLAGQVWVTVLLWAIFFCTFLILSFVPLWTVSLLAHPGGLTTPQAALVVLMYNVGAVLGTASMGRVFGAGKSRRLAAIFIPGGLFIGLIGLTGSVLLMGAAAALLGGFLIAGASAGAITLAASLYPTAVRSSGVGWAMAIGRLGQVLGPLVAGALFAAGLRAPAIFPALASFSLVAAISALLLSMIVDRKRSGDGADL